MVANGIWNPGLKESGIPLTMGIRNPGPGIQTPRLSSEIPRKFGCRIWNRGNIGLWNLESGVLGIGDSGADEEVMMVRIMRMVWQWLVMRMVVLTRKNMIVM